MKKLFVFKSLNIFFWNVRFVDLMDYSLENSIAFKVVLWYVCLKCLNTYFSVIIRYRFVLREKCWNL